MSQPQDPIISLEKQLNDLKLKKRQDLEQQRASVDSQLLSLGVSTRRPRSKPIKSDDLTPEQLQARAEKGRERARAYYHKNKDKILEKQRAARKLLKSSSDNNALASFQLPGFK